MDYRMLFDYHTHTTFSHGKGSIEDNVNVAIQKGLREIAITDHGPGHLTYGIKKKAIPEMRAEIDRLNLLYPEIKIYLGVEANIINKGNCLDVSEKESKDYDFIIAGYHYGVRNGYCIGNYLYKHNIVKTKKQRDKLCELNTKMTIEAIKNNNIKILTHPGDKGPFDVEIIAKACAENNVLMEISTRHSHLTVEEIKLAAKEDVRFIISSDAHTKEAVGTFRGGLDRAMEAGLDLSRIVNIELGD
ncbi:MAG: PHP domain-containing protein [Anaerovoracaceae bacterium]